MNWPGNIRELQNVIESAIITSVGPALDVDVADLKLSNSTVVMLDGKSRKLNSLRKRSAGAQSRLDFFRLVA